MECTVGLSLSNATAYLKAKGALDFQHYTGTESLTAVKEFLSKIPEYQGFEVTHPDMFVLFKGHGFGLLAEFTQGCSSFYYTMDMATVNLFVKTLGMLH